MNKAEAPLVPTQKNKQDIKKNKQGDIPRENQSTLQGSAEQVRPSLVRAEAWILSPGRIL